MKSLGKYLGFICFFAMAIALFGCTPEKEYVIQEVEKEVIVEVPVIVEKEVIQIVEVPTGIKEVEVEVIKEVEVEVEKIVEVIKEVPVEVDKIVRVPIESEDYEHWYTGCEVTRNDGTIWKFINGVIKYTIAGTVTGAYTIELDEPDTNGATKFEGFNDKDNPYVCTYDSKKNGLVNN